MKLDANGWELALTEHQKQFWTGCKLYPQARHFDLRVALHLPPVDPARLRDAFATVVEEEPLLRAAVRERADGPRLAPGEPPSLEVVDLRALGRVELETWLAASAHGRIDPTRALAEATLLLASDGRAVLFLRLHHLIADGWSVKLLAERLAAAYESRRGAGAGPLGGGRLPPFAAHVAQERRYLRSLRRRRDRAYWAELLREPIRPTELYGASRIPVPEGAERATGGAACVRAACTLGKERTRLLRARAAGFSVGSPNRGLSNLLLAALTVLLVRITGVSSQRIGLPRHGRRSERDRSTFGLFMQLTVVSVDLAADQSIASAVQRIAEAVAEADRHSRFTIANPRQRAFDLLFNFHNIDYPTLGGARIEEEWLHSANDEMVLALHVRTTDPENLRVQVEVSGDLAEPQWRAQRIVSDYLRVVDELLTMPDRAISDLDLVAPGERAALLAAGRGPVRGLPETRIELLFEEQAARFPTATALFDQGRAWTFGELDRRANRLADAILAEARRAGEAGVSGASARATVEPAAGPLSAGAARRALFVGGLFERSAEAVAAFLATLKAGGVWVPLDPSLPPARIAAIVGEAGVEILVTNGARHGALSAQLGRLPALRILDGAPSLADDRGAASRPAASGANGRRAASATRNPDDPAYLLFTSGSTGTPKGILGSHRAAINRIAWMWRRYPFEPGEVGAHKSSLSFIDSVWEVFGPLLAGRSVVIVPQGAVADPAVFAALLARHAVRRLILVPSLLLALLDAGPAAEALTGIRRWFVTGEPLSGVLARRFASAYPAAELFNLYGTTEFFDAACLRVGAPERSRDRVPIGEPVDNTCLYLLDQRLRPLPVGIAGELCVSGIGVPAGYLGRAAESPTRFVANPFVDEDRHATLYRTGDAARLLPGGRIELLGRLDRQLKIRGYRVEPEEIELALCGHDAVERAAVFARDAGEDRRSLVAFVQARRGRQVDRMELLRHLRELLPSWMVPRLELVERLPLTTSGKIDRARLATQADRDGRTGSSLRLARFAARADRPPARGAVEASLIAIWQGLLDNRAIGPFDDFFEVGGNSLLALSVVAEIERSLGRRLPLSALFEFPSVAALAAGPLRSLAREGRQLVALTSPRETGADAERAGVTALPLFSIPAAGSTVASFAALARHLPPGQPLYSFQPRGIEGRERPHRTIEEMARSYIAEMRTVQPRGPYAIAGRCFGGYVAFEMARQLQASGETISLLAIMDSKEAPLERGRQRSHTGLRKLLAYYPERFVFHLRRRRLLSTLRMKLANEARYHAFRFARLFGSPRGGGSSLRRRKRNLELLRYLHTRAYHRYVAEPFEGRVTLFWAGTGDSDESGEISRWRRLARGGLECERLPCRHSELLREPFIGELAYKIGQRLAEGQPAAMAAVRVARESTALEGRTEAARLPAPSRLRG